MIVALVIQAICSIVCVRADIFDFHLLKTLMNSTNGEQACKSLGYDGLAIVSTPEAFAYVLKITEDKRWSTGKGVNIGLHYRKDLGQILWDDGSVPAEDTPWLSSTAKKPSTNKPYGRIYYTGFISMETGTNKVHTACGNNFTSGARSEAKGRKMTEVQPEDMTSNFLGSATTLGFLECALFCGQDQRCRLAVFSYGTFTCTILGPYQSLNLLTNTTAVTFVRNRFAVSNTP